MSEAPERLALRKVYMSHAITSGPLMEHPDYIHYVRADRIEELEAKLAKAVEALGDIVKDCEADYPPSHGAIRYFARTTLAELTGDNND